MVNSLCIFLISAWEPFRDLIPEKERGCFIDAYKKRLNSDDIKTQVTLCLVSELSFFIFPRQS